MRILFAGKQHYDPGGIPASIDQLAHQLSLVGHECAVLAHAAYDGSPRPASQRWFVCPERGRGYEAYSVDRLPPGAALAVVIRWFRPDVVVVNAGGSWWYDWTRALVRATPPDLPLVLYLRDDESVQILGELEPRADLVLANAEHHAASAARQGVHALVIPSAIEPELYRSEPTGEAVVFVNPVASRGVETAFAIAEQCPEVPFHFRESWHLPQKVAAEIEERVARLGNVEFLRSTTDVVEIYRRARLLLVPYEDSNRPRVVHEAQISGIPILASDHPSLREAVGPGGILVPPGAPVSVWVDGLHTLWDDATAHRSSAEAARLHSMRVEMAPDQIATRFVDAVTDAVDRHPAPMGSNPHARVDTADRSTPIVSVIIPARNVADTIDEQLAALAGQTYRGPWELIVADNGCTDATRERVEAWRSHLPALSIVDASARRGCAHARNVGLRAARGELLFICDGDDVVALDWLEVIVAALDEHPIVTGFIDVVSMNASEQYDWTGNATMVDAPVGYGYLPYAPCGNVGMWREVFETVGDFDEELLRAEDIDFGWRAHYLGIPVHFEPRAVLHRRLHSDPRAEFRTAIRGGIAESGLYRRHRDRGMPRASRDEVVQQYRWMVTKIPDVIAGRANAFRWAHHTGKRIGRVVGSARNRVTYL